jgi:hypothetical protein
MPMKSFLDSTKKIKVLNNIPDTSGTIIAISIDGIIVRTTSGLQEIQMSNQHKNLFWTGDVVVFNSDGKITSHERDYVESPTITKETRTGSFRHVGNV